MSPRSRFVSRALVVVSLALAPTVARAAQPGVGHGTVMISAERLFGLGAIHDRQEGPGGDTSFDHEHFGLALAPTLTVPTIYLVPRVAFDFAIIDGLTLGGSLGFTIADLEDSTTVTSVLVTPRIGYVLGLSRLFSLWLRAGVTYFNVTSSNDPDTRSDTLWGVSLNVEPTLMIAPFDHVAFTAGVVLDLPLAGEQSTERRVGSVTTTTSFDRTIRHLGLLAGMVVSF